MLYDRGPFACVRSVYGLLHLRHALFCELCAGIRQSLAQIWAKSFFRCLLEMRCHHY